MHYKKEIARLAGIPDFKIGADYTIVGKGNNNMAGTDAIMLPTVGISIPLYRNKYKSMVNEAVYLGDSEKGGKIK